MRVFAALIPPAAELDRVRAVAAGVAPVPDPGARPGVRHRGRAALLLGRRRPTEPSARGPMLDLLPTAAMHLPFAKFGNLSTFDADRLADALEQQATQWPAPRLHLAGGMALEPEGDTSVWVSLGGDVDELREVFRNVTLAAQSLHLFVDRRVFRPDLQVGTITDLTTTAYLEALLAELEAFESNAWWQTSFALVVSSDNGPGRAPFKLHREIRLGPAVAH